MGKVSIRARCDIETAVSNSLVRFAQEYLAGRPKSIRAHLLKDLLVVRFHVVLNAAEQRLLRTSEKDKGRDLLKQMRSELIETARPILESVVTEITGLKVISLHHDISTVTGEEVVIFTLVETQPLHTSRK